MSFEVELIEDGYLVLKEVFPEKELVRLRKLFDDIIQYQLKGDKDPFSRFYLTHRTDQGVLYDLFQRHPEFQDFAKNTTILDSLVEVLGEDIFLYENSLVFKPLAKQNEVPWHQDFINRPSEPLKYIAWIAIDDVTKENGAMKIIPKTHKLGFLPFHTIPGETHHTRLLTDGIDLDSFQFVEMKAGDVLIFNQLLLHSSERIDSAKPRRAYRVSYQGFDQIFTPRATPIVLRGGSPSSVYQKFEKKNTIHPSQLELEKNFFQRILNRVGRKLLDI